MPDADDIEQPDTHCSSVNEHPAESRLTRTPVAKRLGVSVFKVRSMEGKELHPEVVDGVHYFRLEEVEGAARALNLLARPVTDRRSSGAIAALIFRAFDDDKDLNAIVTEFEVPPETVRALYREWREPDLEEHEIARQRRERAETARRRDAEQQRRHEARMAEMDRTLRRTLSRSND